MEKWRISYPDGGFNILRDEKPIIFISFEALKSHDGCNDTLLSGIINKLNSHAALLAACKAALEFLTDINKGHVQIIQLRSAIKAGESGE